MNLPISATKGKVAKEEASKYKGTITVVAVGEAGSGAERWMRGRRGMREGRGRGRGPLLYARTH